MNRNIQIDTEQPKPLLQLLQDVVSATARLWDAQRALEVATAPGGEYSDRAADAVVDYCNTLTADLNSADEAYLKIDEKEHLKKVLSLSAL